MKPRIKDHLLLGFVLGLGLSGCVIRAGSDSDTVGLSDVEQFSSTGQALDKVSMAGLIPASDLRRSLHNHKALLEEVAPIVLERPDDTLVRHQQSYLSRTVEFYEEQLELSNLLEDASNEHRPGVVSQIYGSQRLYLEDIAALDRNLEFPVSIDTPWGAGGIAAPALQEGNLSDGTQLNVAEVRRMFEAGDYQTLVSQAAEAVAGGESLSPETRSLYALALAKEGLLTEAIKQGEALAQEPMSAPELIDVRLSAGLWLMEVGQWAEAEGLLRTVQADSAAGEGDLKAMGAVAEAMLREMTSQAKDLRLVAATRAMEQKEFAKARVILDEISASDVPQNVKNRSEALRRQMSSGEAEAFEQRLFEVREVTAKSGSSKQGKSLVYAIKADFPDPTYESRIDALEKELQSSAKVENIDYEATLEEAKDLLARDSYLEAVAAFDKLTGTPVSAEAKTGRERAVELYVHKVREDTARDYLAARRIKDPTKRLASLGKIYKHLSEVSARFPESQMMPKIANHMQVLKQDILVIDPTYFD